MDYAIEVKNLDVSYGNNLVLDNINVKIPINTRSAIVGSNGAGKSTFIKAILGLIKKDRGEIKILNKSLEEVKTSIAYVPQKDSVNWQFPTTVIDVVMMGMYKKMKSFGRISNKEKALAMAALEEMGIADLKNRQINNLSGGQKQRVFLARALVSDADIYILDEPLTGVDMKTEDIISDEFLRLQKRGKTIIAVHHNIYTLNKYFDNLVVLNKNIKYCGPLFINKIDEVINLGFRS
ncbi:MULTISPECIES: metal ABC transporter ATP-binding protein [Anaerococcus]|uniref:metal ABC transporter ATP-binding protein n=1 Tax=Anaerococcus TaxID=165779 RepID=UPI00258988EC|nr:ABC transporter ATP-binding protein [Anaerococcus sp.]MDU2565262.1 ABC transporter ATP-binding protein [Anaerococcus sp.]MDU3210979.1 ABC transporter ATP-binding protein [Anaerococcus sp.]